MIYITECGIVCTGDVIELIYKITIAFCKCRKIDKQKCKQAYGIKMLVF
jgi:hypothetical protein